MSSGVFSFGRGGGNDAFDIWHCRVAFFLAMPFKQIAHTRARARTHERRCHILKYYYSPADN